MRSKFVFILSIKNERDHTHSLIFKATREIPVNYPGLSLHWYTNEVKLHADYEIYGWCGVGNHDQITNLNESIEKAIPFDVYKHSISIKKDFESAKIKSLPDQDAVGEFPPLFYKSHIDKFAIKDWANKIGAHCPLLLEDSFCDDISGQVKSNRDINAIQPLGFWSKGELLNYFKEQVTEVDEYIIPLVSFRGVGEINTKSIEGFRGVLKHFPESLQKVHLEFWDIENTSKIHEFDVPLSLGWATWEQIFKNAPARGILFAKDGEVVLGAEKFHLLLDINIDIQPQDNQDSIIDLYGRRLSLKKKAELPKAKRNLIWHSDISDKEETFSDELSNILASLGEKVLIQDPYFIGKVEEAGKTSKGSKSFLNAIIKAILNYELKELSILIDPKKLNVTDKTALEKKLNHLYSPLKDYGLEKFEICYSSTSFHDRYFIGLTEPHTIYSVSKSINSFLDTNDLNIHLYESESKANLLLQVLHRLNKSTRRQIV